ncbi:unnamed protein product [Allacma fusca]|uniref:Uncharacterized protein n=1 Tax=Allacma fusca TaxID=39272 RepID=A0A8J2LJ41_9HEXA|nr:unnamed protein product [Allacma fusca]
MPFVRDQNSITAVPSVLILKLQSKLRIGKGSDRKSSTSLRHPKGRTRAPPVTIPVERTSDYTHCNKKMLPSRFDRHGRMTRVTADYNQDSEDSEMRFVQKKLSKMTKRQESVLRNYVNNIDYIPVSVTSGASSDDEFGARCITGNKPVHYTDECITKCLSFLDNYEFEEEPKSSNEFEKLTEALQHLENICKSEFLVDPAKISPKIDKSEDILTICPTKPMPFKCESSTTQAPSDAMGKTNDAYINDWMMEKSSPDFSLRNYFCAGNKCESFEMDKQVLNEQKEADIWEWVSPAYTRDVNSRMDQASINQLITQPQHALTHSSVNQQKRYEQYSYGDNPLLQVGVNSETIENPADETLLDLKTIRSTADELPITPRTIFAPITAAIQDVLKNTTKIQHGTPPASSSWSVSPIYKGDNEPTVFAEEPKEMPKPVKVATAIRKLDDGKMHEVFSNCSLAAGVSSGVSMADLQSSEDIPTRCSSNSTFSDYDGDCRDASENECVPVKIDQHNHEPLTEFSAPAEHTKPVSFNRYISGIVQNEITESLYNPELPSISSKSQTPQMNFRSIRASTCYKSNTSLVDQDPPKQFSTDDVKVKGVSSDVKPSTSIEGKNKQCRSVSKISEYSNSKKSKRNKEKKKDNDKEKGKKNKRDKEGAESEKKSKMRQHKDSVTQTLAEQPIQRLKNALPRTPGGRYSLEGKAAEDAISAYVKAELAASLECAEVTRNGNSKTKIKPAYGSLAEFLRRVAINDPKLKSRLDKGALSNSKLSVKCNGTKKKCVPKYVSKPRIVVHERPKNIILPRQSNRINFIRYQQQSMAAMMHYSKSRNSKKQSSNVGLRDSTEMTSLNRKDYRANNSRGNAFNNRFKGNRNMVTVVFDKPPELYNVQ